MGPFHFYYSLVFLFPYYYHLPRCILDLDTVTLISIAPRYGVSAKPCRGLEALSLQVSTVHQYHHKRGRKTLKRSFTVKAGETIYSHGGTAARQGKRRWRPQLPTKADANMGTHRSQSHERPGIPRYCSTPTQSSHTGTATLVG